MTEAPVSLLLLEDNADDAALLQLALNATDLPHRLRWVDRGEDFEAALAEPCDAVLADYRLPGYSATRALDALRQRRLDLPLILVSGAIGEEQAAELMRKGAADCCMKDRLERLPAIVRREVRAARLRQQHERTKRLIRARRRQQMDMLRNLGGMLFRLDLGTGRFEYAGGNRTLLNRMDKVLAPGSGPAWERVLHPEDRAAVRNRVQALVQAGERGSVEFRLAGPDDASWFRLTAAPSTDDAGSTLDGYLEDISEQRQSRERMHLFSRILEQTADTVIVTDQQFVITFVNPAFERVTGFRSEEAIGHSIDLIRSGLNDDSVYQRMEQALTRGDSCQEVFVNRRKSGEIYYEQKTITPIHDDNGTRVAVVGTGRDITETIQYRERLDFLRYHDPLTELPNRARLEEYLQAMLPRTAADGAGMGLLMLDLNRFSDLNDVHGHATGDHVLRRVAARLEEFAREEDLAARCSADVFALAIPGLVGQERVSDVATRLMTIMEATVKLPGGDTVYLNPSIGLHWCSNPETDPQQLIADTQRALNRAKAVPGLRIADTGQTTSEPARERLQLVTSLRTALEEEEFYLAYQPQILLRDGSVTGHEALLRWRRDGSVPARPDQFIDALEASGLIVPVGQWVLEEACRQWRRWQDQGLEPGRISVNLSVTQLSAPDLPRVVEHAMSSNGLPPDTLELEITENAFLSDLDAHLQTLSELRRLGVRLALDDFGTGYSSLSYLKNFPVQTLKIDRTFIREITTNPGDAAITRAIIRVAKELELAVVAEGVETESQVGYLQQQDCDLVQGYYYDRPLEADELTALLRDNRVRQVPIMPRTHDEGTLLVVDDEPSVLSSLRRLLRREPYRMLSAADAKSAFEALALNRVDVMLVDQRMPGTSGTDLLRTVKRMYPDTVRMVLSGYTDVTAVTEAVNSGAIYKFIAKPWDDGELRAHIADGFHWARGSSQR